MKRIAKSLNSDIVPNSDDAGQPGVLIPVQLDCAHPKDLAFYKELINNTKRYWIRSIKEQFSMKDRTFILLIIYRDTEAVRAEDK